MRGTACRTCNRPHGNGYPIGEAHVERLLDAYYIEQGKADGVEDEPRVVLPHKVFAEEHDAHHCQGAADKVAAVSHPEGVDTQHEVAQGAASDGSGHAHYPGTEYVELLGRRESYARESEGEGANELNDHERDGQSEGDPHLLQDAD